MRSGTRERTSTFVRVMVMGAALMLLPGLVRAQDDPNVEIAVASCGNGALDTGEACDPPGATTPSCVVGERCGPTCQCEPVLDHFKCYRAILKAQRSLFHQVSLDGRFESGRVLIKKARHFCNAAGLNGEAIADPANHLTCYSLREGESNGIGGERRKQVTIDNDLGHWKVRLKARSELCVPSTRGQASVPELDHYKCYWVRYFWASSPRIELTLEDEYETKSAVLLKPRLVCNPVDADGQGIINSTDQLACYEIDERHPRKIGNRRMQRLAIANPYDQGRLLLSAKYRKELCVRSTITEVPKR